MSIPKAKTASPLGPRRPLNDAEPASAPSVAASFVDPDEARSKLTVNIDAQLHRRFKASAAASGKTMRDVVEEAIEQWIDTNTAHTS